MDLWLWNMDTGHHVVCVLPPTPTTQVVIAMIWWRITDATPHFLGPSVTRMTQQFHLTLGFLVWYIL